MCVRHCIKHRALHRARVGRLAVVQRLPRPLGRLVLVHVHERVRPEDRADRDARRVLDPRKTTSYELPRRRDRRLGKTGPLFNVMGKDHHKYKNGAYSQAASEAERKAANAERSRKYAAKKRRLQG